MRPLEPLSSHLSRSLTAWIGLGSHLRGRSEWIGNAAPDALALSLTPGSQQTSFTSQLGHQTTCWGITTTNLHASSGLINRGFKEKELFRCPSPRGACLPRLRRNGTCRRRQFARHGTRPKVECGQKAGLDHGRQSQAVTPEYRNLALVNQATAAQTLSS